MSRRKHLSDQLEVERIWNEATEMILKDQIAALERELKECKDLLDSEYARGVADGNWEARNHPLQKGIS